MPATSIQPARRESRDEPLGPQVADERRHEPHERGSGEEDDLGEQDVDGEPDRPGGDTGVRDVRNLPPADSSLGGVVGSFGAAPNAAHHFLGQRRGLSLHGGAHCGARCDVLDDLPGEPALERFDHQSLEAGARQCSVDEPLGRLVVECIRDCLLELGCSGDLCGDAFRDTVLGERARERIGQRAGQRLVDRSLDLGRGKQVARACLESFSAPGTGLEAVGGQLLSGTPQHRADDRGAGGEAHGQKREPPRCGTGTDAGSDQSEGDVVRVRRASHVTRIAERGFAGKAARI